MSIHWKVGRLFLLAAGVIVSAIGLAHILMPTLGYAPNVAASMPPEVRDHFYQLGTYAICGFLLTQAAITLYFARASLSPATSFVALMLFAFWVARFVMELRYPVMLSLFSVNEPHAVLLPVIGFVAVAYGLAAVKSRLALHRASSPA